MTDPASGPPGHAAKAPDGQEDEGDALTCADSFDIGTDLCGRSRGLALSRTPSRDRRRTSRLLLQVSDEVSGGRLSPLRPTLPPPAPLTCPQRPEPRRVRRERGGTLRFGPQWRRELTRPLRTHARVGQARQACPPPVHNKEMAARRASTDVGDTPALGVRVLAEVRRQPDREHDAAVGKGAVEAILRLIRPNVGSVPGRNP